MARSMLHVPVDDLLREQAAETLASGMLVPTAVKLLLQQVIGDPGMTSRRQGRSSRDQADGELRELDCVRLAADVTTAEGTLRAGQLGAIVYRHGSGEAFEVEFTEPFNTVLTLRRSEIEPLG